MKLFRCLGSACKSWSVQIFQWLQQGWFSKFFTSNFDCIRWNIKIKFQWNKFQENKLFDRVYNMYSLMHTNQCVQFVENKVTACSDFYQQ